jgi:hypothetical protein
MHPILALSSDRLRFLGTVPKTSKSEVTHVPEVGRSTFMFLPGDDCVVPHNHPLAASGEHPSGSQIPDICPIGRVCGKVKYPGANYLLGE